jgi:hypothetical protein
MVWTIAAPAVSMWFTQRRWGEWQFHDNGLVVNVSFADLIDRPGRPVDQHRDRLERQ